MMVTHVLPVQLCERPDGCKAGVAECGGRSSDWKMECRRLLLLEVPFGVTDHRLYYGHESNTSVRLPVKASTVVPDAYRSVGALLFLRQALLLRLRS